MQKWEYMYINCGIHINCWIPRFINANEIPNWQNGSNIIEISNQLGEQGWEIISVNITDTSHNRDCMLVLKRPKVEN